MWDYIDGTGTTPVEVQGEWFSLVEGLRNIFVSTYSVNVSTSSKKTALLQSITAFKILSVLKVGISEELRKKKFIIILNIDF